MRIAIVGTLPKDALQGFSNEIAHKIERIKSLPLEVNKFRWVTQLGKVATVYSSMVNLPEDSDKPVAGKMDFGGNLELWGECTDAEKEQRFTRAVDKLLLQALLYMQLKPDSISATPPEAHQSGRGFGGFGGVRKSDPYQTLEPIWIGKNYKPKTGWQSTGSHASPETH